MVGGITREGVLGQLKRMGMSLAQLNMISIPACTGASWVIVSPQCWAARYVWLTEQEGIVDLRELSSNLYKEKTNFDLSTLAVVNGYKDMKTNEVLSSTIPLAISDLRSMTDPAVHALNTAVGTAISSTNKIVNDLYMAFRKSYDKLYQSVGVGLNAGNRQSMMNINALINQAN